jgi:hypothetical protein
MTLLYSIHTLPLEILESIQGYLEPKEYHCLRLSFKSHLPKKQKLMPLFWLDRYHKYYRISPVIIDFYNEFVCEKVWIRYKTCYGHYDPRDEKRKMLKIGFQIIARMVVVKQPDWFMGEDQELAFVLLVDGYGLDGLLLWVKMGFDPSICDNQSITMASNLGSLEIVSFLLQDPRVDPSVRRNIAVRLASSKGHAEVVRILLEDPRVNPADCAHFAIQHASKNGHLEVVTLLLKDSRVNPSANGNFAIRKAWDNGFLNVVKVLLKDSRLDPAAANVNYAIADSSRNGDFDIISMLLQHRRTGH